MSADASPLIWIDLEMSGLEPDRHFVLEIASLVTGSNLELIAEGPELVIHHGEEVIEGMNEWCQVQHRQSGLVDKIRASTISTAEAERLTLEFLRAHTEPGQSPLCGNSIGLDDRFLLAHMPALAAFTSGELIDVTTLKELARRWYPGHKAPPKSESHRARDDILESVAELQFYRQHFFATPSGSEGSSSTDRAP